ncbi:stomatal closure-related actin-binding protein 2 [Andrographis paniculata]|uniref:stomatal closure-related actin-binding protein 2 n=1 Tax=Andrographis paniculata TaxID=175694 RepID=UPI0021E7798B|nr:stomatal closure-related actin-binding protein 2 [Andrographis paniculata]XP_051149593.1 stomatal closure-related actin-binding protein 2 [Andrographis paniculata]XP_051149594.1 stomatal closure-related actin-binding protein 2 [Andrographis paniculata]
MTRISPEYGDVAQPAWVLSSDVSFPSNQFPKYRLGPDNQIWDEIIEDSKGPPLKEVVVEEINHLSEQHKRLSVRDLASKFDKNLAAAAKLSEEAKLREVASLDGHVLLKKLRDALECLKGRLSGRNKEDVEKAISMVEALAVKLTQKEGELIQEKFEVKKLVNFLKQASEDAKKLVNQEKSFACAEIESARAVVQRIGEALDEQERNNSSAKQQELEELIEEVQEARRIRLKHDPTKVMDMEHELRELRLQIREKCTISINLQHELAMSKKAEENAHCVYALNGSETLGLSLRIQPCSEEAVELAKCSIQWYRLLSQCSRREPILGATKSVYAPEPIDVGRVLEVDIVANGQKFSLTTNGPIQQAIDLDSYLESLFRKPNHDFSVVISQMNGRNYSSHSTHVFHIGKSRIKLSRGWITKARESYSRSMQLFGFRGGGNSAGKSLVWLARKGQSFVLVFESERERNSALLLARKYASDCNVLLAGPDDDALL